MSRRFYERTRLLGAPVSAIVASWIRRGVLKSVQRGTITIANGAATNTATITTVDLPNTIVRYLGNSESNGGSNDGFAFIQLTNATTVTATRNGTGQIAIVSFEVLEYYPGVLKSVQRTTITLATVLSNTATITAVDLTKALVYHLGNSTDDVASGNAANWFVRVVLTNATTVTATCGSALNTQIVSVQVVEWY